MDKRDDLPKFFKDKGFKIGAEIGAWKGEFSAKFCKEGLKMYVIDPWMPFEGQGRTQRLQEVQDGYFNEARRNLSPYGENVVIIRKTSMDALADVPNKSLDFVYIDGDHNFRHTAEDIFEWSKKVRSGGIVAGHDYWNTPYFARNVVCQVKAVVDAYVNLFEIKDLQILKGDKYPSWLYTKR